MRHCFIISLLLAFQAKAFANDAVAVRMEQVSAKLLGKTYVNDPLGEGDDGRFDRDPRLRTDAFDCTTFVETVIATAKSKDSSEVLGKMDAIRYHDAVVSFQTRNHFPALEWIKNNVENGLFVDVTKDVDPTGFDVAEALIEKDNWYRKLSISRLSGIPLNEKPQRLVELRALGDLFGKEIERVHYVPKARLINDPKILANIPNGAVLNLVRPGWDVREEVGTRLNITHQGLAFKRNGVVYFRHASKTGKTMEVVLTNYLKSAAAKPIAGLNILIVR